MSEDRRARVPLDGKRIDLELLSAELGVGLTASDSEVVVADPNDKVTRKQLAAAVAAHTPPPVTEPQDPLTGEEIAALRALLAAR